MYTKLPALDVKQLLKLLQKDGWVDTRRARHGVSLTKRFDDRTRVTVIPTSRAILDEDTLSAILGPKQRHR